MNRLKFISAVLVVFLFSGCFDGEFFGKKEQNAQIQAPQMPPAEVDVMVAKIADNKMSFEYPVRLESTQDVIITPKVSGTLTKQKFKAGDRVKAGDVIFVIDDAKFRATYDVASAAVLQAEATHKSAKSEINRVKNLISQKAVSQKEYDTALANFESASATLASAKASAKAAKIDLEYTEIKAPFDGILGENLIDVGSYVTTGITQLVRLSKTSPIQARFYIADSANLDRLTNVANNQWVQINSDATLLLNNENFNGKIVFIDSVVDKNTGSVLAKAEFENSDNRLLAGTFARIVMNGFVQKNSFLVPQVAIKQDTTSAYVLIVKDGVVAKRQVKIVYQTSSKAIISAGLEDGDVIILNNFNKIGVGAPVKPDIKEQN